MNKRQSILYLPNLSSLALLSLLLFGCGGGGGSGSAASLVVNLPVDDGADTSPATVSCTALADLPTQNRVRLERVFPDLQFEQPVALLQAPGDSRRWFVLEKAGRVLTFTVNGTQAVNVATFLDISDRVDSEAYEAGLYGMAFHPDFANNNQVYLSYTRTGAPLVSYVSRFLSYDGGRTLDPASETVLLTLDQPSVFHHGGHLDFGSDGYLYIAFGDGGPRAEAQNTDRSYAVGRIGCRKA